MAVTTATAKTVFGPQENQFGQRPAPVLAPMSIDRFSKNAVGRTGFEPVTFSVSECRLLSPDGGFGLLTCGLVVSGLS
jgi:hypothetical protein